MTTRDKTMKAFLRRHRQWLTFIGASVILMTFLAKETWRDTLKDLVASIDTAENVFLLRQATRPDINWVQEAVNAANPAAQGEGRDQEALMHRARRRQEKLREKQNTLQISLDNLGRLIEKLPDSVDRDEQFEAFRKYWDDLRTSELAFGSALINGRNTKEDPVQHTLRVESEVDLKLVELGLFAAKTLDEAEAIRRNKEDRLRMATFASYGLYAVGWMLGLVGRLCGVEGLGE